LTFKEIKSIKRKKTIKEVNVAIINLKDFPEELHRKAKSKAALMGISLRELIIRAITEFLERHK
jgi:predicted HicB family RNase H-like nuclease